MTNNKLINVRPLTDAVFLHPELTLLQKLIMTDIISFQVNDKKYDKSSSKLADELEEMKRLAHEGLPDDCVKGWDEVKFCENRQGDGNMCKWCSNYR
jgi:hypothetical protein